MGETDNPPTQMVLKYEPGHCITFFKTLWICSSWYIPIASRDLMYAIIIYIAQITTYSLILFKMPI